MPDFEDRLERELVDEVRRTTRRRRILAAGATAGSGAVLASVVLATMDGTGPLGPTEAQARPLPAILYNDATDPKPSVAEVGIRSAQVERARAFKVATERGYVVPNGRGDWCISIPDLDADSPAVERATSCVAGQRQLREFGLSVHAGRVVAAAVPPNAEPPVRSYNGTRTVVPVDEDGIAVVDDLRPGERLTVYGDEARAHSYTNRVDVKKFITCSDGRPVTAPDDC